MSVAAKLAGIHRTSFYRLLEKHGLRGAGLCGPRACESVRTLSLPDKSLSP